MDVLQICSILVYLAAGFCVFLVLLNRFLILLPYRKAKTPIILAAFLGICGAALIAGLCLPRVPWVFAPAAILCVISVGEARRAFIRRSCAGSKPIDPTPRAAVLSRPITTKELIVRRFEVPHSKWSGAPLRIVLLTDLHIHPRMTVAYYQRVLEIAEQARPDLALFTGDLVANPDCLPTLREVLRPIAGIGTFAVLGNHDYWTNPEMIGSVVADLGLRLLRNESVTVKIQGVAVTVTGYDYPWGTRQKSVAIPLDARLHLVLSHTPDNIYRLAKSNADIVFTGHYHGGQIRIPFVGPIVIPSVYGRRFDRGHFVVNGTHLFVSSGVGAAKPMVRIYCRPDIFVVDILGGNRSNKSAEI